MLTLPDALRPLAAYRQFILWRAVPREDGKIDKLPVDSSTGAVADAHDPSIWVTADEATTRAALFGIGVGFVFTEQDPFFFLDIDDALEGNKWSDNATNICKQFAGCAVEVSTSGTGLHIIGTMPERIPHSIKPADKTLKTDLFTERRFIALTGMSAVGSASFIPAQSYRGFLAEHYPPSAVTSPSEWSDTPDPEWDGPEDDAELIARMLRSKSASAAFGGKASVQELWGADEEALGRHFPDDQGNRPFDWSLADAALLQHLAFWTGKNCERMDRLFRQSGLMRDKWDSRDDYRFRSAGKAVSMCSQVYRQAAPTTTTGTDEPAADPFGLNLLTVQQQIEHFAGCVYVRDAHQIFTPDGGMLKPDQFRAMYGGYLFSMDAINDKTTKSAFEAFTESRGHRFPKVFKACFRPELPAGQVLEEAGQPLVNTYVPVPVPCAPGDPSPFLGHLARIVPDPGDQRILLSYMAACVQHIGVKFQWSPLLQGAQGNGKSLFTSCVAEAVGWVYTHKPNAKDLGNKFNGWIDRKVFIGVEEVYVQDRREAIDTLKPMITDGKLEIQGKGSDQVTGDNRANFFMCTNHKDAIRITRNDRRFCVFYTAQQSREDIIAHGMGGRYFPDLYKWLNDGGYAIVTHYLRSYAIPDELNPATSCHRAPETTSTDEAITVSMGGVEQEIAEAAMEGLPGFSNGWVSTIALGRLLEKRKVTQNKRKEILADLGYVHHPALPDGRVNNQILQEGGKPRLYVKVGHINQSITSASLARQKYMEDQGWSADAGIGAGPAVAVAPPGGKP